LSGRCDVAALVLEVLQGNEFYIFTLPHMRPWLQKYPFRLL
jgi:hypothetical protein